MPTETAEADALLTVTDLKKYYPIRGGIISHTVARVRAVDGVSFSIRRGETLGLVGESGCGKSTIGRQLVALERPTSGKIVFDGQEISALPEKKLRGIRTQLQMVFQDSYSSLNPRKRVFEILAREPPRRLPACLNLWACPETAASAFRTSFPAVSASASASRGRSRSARG